MAIAARAEHVGSLLRPGYLLDARAARARGELTDSEFKAVEDRAVREAVALQADAGCPVVTDGELRRESFQGEFTASVDGVSGASIDAWLWGDWYSDVVGDQHVERPGDLAVTGRLRKRRNLAAEEFTFLRSCVGERASPDGPGAMTKVTLPSPSLFAGLWSPENAGEPYATLDDFLSDVTRILCDEVRELVRLGCRYIQLDAPHYPLLVDPSWREFYERRGWAADQWLSYGIELDNAVIAAGRPATFGFHLCRGNQRSRWLVAGGYDPIAAPVFSTVHADRLLLEYDDERSGGFDPLRLVPEDTSVVLGLVTTKHREPEPVDALVERVDVASGIIGRERLAVGTQCGFATSLYGNALSIDDQHRKLALVVRVAELAFG
ncbi:cobalamin-independent methionine synthase II family protein [Haloechinothrix sp. YIM 98757]|uniref:Cobalamin-independent methionine synthase II family protein n=1 Tax=Haloechinothrix aidingensis TaxID=2752311 RepID=A0A838A5M4_9PSEU|nr:cobalamin-independent methionine synthase II family protein [Haloechinothrix aidingensis]MBA0124308.1 cobalamin-independent methionine synthase II family protein [Haloechinothrix aidingensis]